MAILVYLVEGQAVSPEHTKDDYKYCRSDNHGNSSGQLWEIIRPKYRHNVTHVTHNEVLVCLLTCCCTALAYDVDVQLITLYYSLLFKVALYLTESDCTGEFPFGGSLYFFIYTTCIVSYGCIDTIRHPFFCMTAPINTNNTFWCTLLMVIKYYWCDVINNKAMGHIDSLDWRLTDGAYNTVHLYSPITPPQSICCVCAAIIMFVVPSSMWAYQTDLNGATIFLLNGLKIHTEEGKAARQIGICFFWVPASVGKERLGGNSVLHLGSSCTAYTQQIMKHTCCIKYLEAKCCLPDTALKGWVQPTLTVAAWNPLQRGGQGCANPVEEQYRLSNIDTIHTGLKISQKKQTCGSSDNAAFVYISAAEKRSFFLRPWPSYNRSPILIKARE